MRSYQEYKQTKPEGKAIFSKMFEARQVTHIKHLQTKSYSEHQALGDFYESLLGLIDSFIETYQGQYGIINEYTNIDSNVSASSIDYITNFAGDVKEFHGSMDGDSHLQNILDEMVALCYKTLYKLKNLK